MDDDISLLDMKKKSTITIIETEVKDEDQLTPKSSNHKVNVDVVDPSSTSQPHVQTCPFSRSCVPPRDKGWPAWLVLCAAIVVEGTLFAFPLTFGVFQEFFGQDKHFSNASYSIWIGVLSTGFPYLAAPLMTVVCEKQHQSRWKLFVLFGWIICAVSLVSAAFSNSLLALALTQGLLYAAGLLFIDVPTLLIINTWFIKRRGTAYGVLCGMTDLIGFGMTILAEFLLRTYDLKVTLLSFGCGIVVLCGPAIWILKPRPIDVSKIPVLTINQTQSSSSDAMEEEELTPTPLTRSATSTLFPRQPKRYFYLPVFYIFALANLLHSLAYYLPFMYLPSYATSLNFSPTRAAYLLAGANFAQIFGELSFGYLSDRIDIHYLILLGSLVSSISVLALWGLAQSYAALAMFALIFGSFGSGMISLWARMGTFFGKEDAQMIYSIMALGRGIGSISSGPISSALLSFTATRGVSAGGGGLTYGNSKYAGVILFVGVAMAASASMGVIGLLSNCFPCVIGSRKNRKSFQELNDENT